MLVREWKKIQKMSLSEGGMRIKKEYLLIGLLVFIAFFLRVYKINTDLLFHRDQGLVAMDIYRIWHDKKITLIGAPSDVDGLSHAATYYWILTPFYALGKGNVVFPAVFQILLEVLSLPFLYFAVKKFFNKRTAFFTLLIYSFSYGMISYSRWFITVPFILPLANILLYVLARNGKYKFVTTSFLVGFITQINSAVGIFYVPFVFYFFRKKITWKNFLIGTFAFLLPALPLIIFQFRHDFVTLRAVSNYVLSSGDGVGFSFNVFYKDLVTFIKEVNHSFLYPLYTASTFLFVWGLFCVGRTKHRKLFMSYLFIPFLFLGLFQRSAISFFYIASLPVVISVVSYGISKFSKRMGLVLVTLILLLNIFNLEKIYRPTNALIPIGDRNLITLQDRKNVIDWMYEKAEKKEFSLWIYTLPYFQDYPWEYLLLTYGQDKYEYLPEKTGSFSPNDLEVSKYFFNVYEIDHDNSSRQTAWFNEVDKNFGEIVDFYRSNDVFVEARKIPNY